MAVVIDGTDGISAPAVNAGNNVGQVATFAMSTAPAGWMKANGATVSRTTYADLFAAIGTTFGVGDGSTTFNLPDLRGEFVRGWDDGRGVDSGRGFGSAQSDELESHSHNVTVWTRNDGSTTYRGIQSIDSGWFNTTVVGGISNTGGTETRPRNVALLACIKF